MNEILVWSLGEIILIKKA